MENTVTNIRNLIHFRSQLLVYYGKSPPSGLIIGRSEM